MIVIIAKKDFFLGQAITPIPDGFSWVFGGIILSLTRTRQVSEEKGTASACAVWILEEGVAVLKAIHNNRLCSFHNLQ
jgi:hypothetical protein